jgi:general secretion pathway protein J
MVLAGEVVEDRDARPPEALVPDLREARFRYRGLDDQNQLGDWSDEWDTTDRLPLQVRIDIQSADGMVWPTLVVALPQAASAGVSTGEFR